MNNRIGRKTANGLNKKDRSIRRKIVNEMVDTFKSDLQYYSIVVLPLQNYPLKQSIIK